MRKSRTSWGRGFWVALFAGGVGLVLPACSTSQGRRPHPVQASYSVNDTNFARTVGQRLQAPWVGGNRIRILLNGDESFPAMLDAIRRAQHSITFENFIWRPGQNSAAFTEAFLERARAGVSIHITTDAVGSAPLPESQIRQLKQAGIQIRKHNPLRIDTVLKWNHRTHRRLLIVDGRIGFIGGIALADSWMGNGQIPLNWRDNHYRVEGPVVSQMQDAFMDNWVGQPADRLVGPAYFPELAPAGHSLAQCFISGTQTGQGHARFAYTYAIAAARHHIRLSQAYFIPDESALQDLLQARARGVKVEIIVPAIPNVKLAYYASRACWSRLLQAGVEIYQYLPTRYHCKTLIVDDLWVSLGTVNFDNRSFQINDEVNLNIQDPTFAARQIELFEQDKARSRRVQLQELTQRSWTSKWVEKFALLLQSQL